MNVEVKRCQDKHSVPFLVQNNKNKIILVSCWEENCVIFSGTVVNVGEEGESDLSYYSDIWVKKYYTPLPSSTKITLSNEA